MPIGARRIAAAAITTAVAAALATTGITPASASPTDCHAIAAMSGAKLTACVGDLRTRSESAGRAAAKADETYLEAKRAAATARKQLDALAAAAALAHAVADRSRARAAVVAATLARTGGSVGQTTEVLMSGDGAGEMLYHLSRMGELTEDSTQLADDAARDTRTAEDLQAQAGLAADRLATSEQRAQQTYEQARGAADAARLLVQQAEVKQSGGVSTATSRAALQAYVDLPSDASVAAKVVGFARAQIGEPYVFGAAGPSAWDCSGLTLGAFQAAGIAIGGHGVNVQHALAASRGLLVPYGQAEPGDLLFYGSGDFFHIAMYSGGGNMIEAPYPGRSVREVPVRTAELAPQVARFTG